MGFEEDTLAAPRPDEVVYFLRGSAVCRQPEWVGYRYAALARALRVSKFGMWVQVRRWCSSTDPDPAMSGQ